MQCSHDQVLWSSHTRFACQLDAAAALGHPSEWFAFVDDPSSYSAFWLYKASLGLKALLLLPITHGTSPQPTSNLSCPHALLPLSSSIRQRFTLLRSLSTLPSRIIRTRESPGKTQKRALPTWASPHPRCIPPWRPRSSPTPHASASFLVPTSSVKL